jgi:predicted ATP-grasp superfamily ATP-dependent carboligase
MWTNCERILVLGDYRQTIVVVRSLARSGYRVSLGTGQAHGSTAMSRYVSDVTVFDDSNRERFLDQLEDYLQREKPAYVFPVGEAEARSIAHAAERLMPLASWVMPEPATVLRCLDKREIYALTPALGIPTAPWRNFTGVADWSRAACEMGFPVVVKRKDSATAIRQKKAIILRSHAAFERFLAELEDEPDPESLLLQKFAYGGRHNCHIAADRGRIVAFFQQRVLRTDELDGTGIGIEGASVAISDSLRDYCERLVKALDYQGIGCIQFMVDEKSGAVAFLEINPRLDSTAALPYRLGYDYPRIATQIAARNAPPLLTKPYPIGKSYHWLYGDTLCWCACCKHRRKSRYELANWALRTSWRSLTAYHLTWEASDPLPTLHRFMKKFFECIFKRAPLAPTGARKASIAADGPRPVSM